MPKALISVYEVDPTKGSERVLTHFKSSNNKETLDRAERVIRNSLPARSRRRGYSLMYVPDQSGVIRRVEVRLAQESSVVGSPSPKSGGGFFCPSTPGV